MPWVTWPNEKGISSMRQPGAEKTSKTCQNMSTFYSMCKIAIFRAHFGCFLWTVWSVLTDFFCPNYLTHHFHKLRTIPSTKSWVRLFLSFLSFLLLLPGESKVYSQFWTGLGVWQKGFVSAQYKFTEFLDPVTIGICPEKIYTELIRVSHSPIFVAFHFRKYLIRLPGT